MPPIAGIRVVKSTIHGYGIVATNDFKAGDCIAVIDGVPLRRSELQNDDYCLMVDQDVFLDMVDQTRWINHSCDPNCEIDSGIDPHGRIWAVLEAIRDIAPGEELTFDYAFAPEYAIPCRCGAVNCRGVIVEQLSNDECA